MRIALISYEYSPYISGGIGNYTRQAALMLLRFGYEVEVFAACPDRSYSDELEGVKLHYGRCADRWQFAPVAAEMFAGEHAARPFDVVEAPELASEGQEIFRRFPELPSVVRLHTPSYLAAWVDRAAFGRTAVFLQALRYGLAELVRGRWPANGIGFWRCYSSLESSYDQGSDEERATALLADVLASPSKRLASVVTHDWSLPEGRVRVVSYPHTPDSGALKMPCVEGSIRTIGFYGGVKAFKGVDILARAIPQILQRHPEVKFVFAGSSQVSPVRNLSIKAFVRAEICSWDDMETWLRRRLASHSDAVQFRGQLDRAGVRALLEDTDLCVFPSRFDNFPNVCLEAMAAGRLIVATRSGGMEEMLAPANAGCLVVPGSHAELAKAICEMIENSEARLGMARRARQRVLAAYGDKVIGPEYEQLYAEAIGRAAGTTRANWN